MIFLQFLLKLHIIYLVVPYNNILIKIHYVTIKLLLYKFFIAAK